MPQIAQQDYIIIKPAVGNYIYCDAAALGRMAAIMERKDTTIFDVLIEPHPSGGEQQKVIAAFRGSDRAEWTVLFFEAEDSAWSHIQIIYTPAQYEGLAAVQLAGLDIEETFREELPVLSTINVDGVPILTDNSGYHITDTEGHGIIATISDGKLAAVEISDVISPGTVIKVPFEDIQKLIGLPIK